MSEKYKNKYRIDSARASWWDYGSNATYFVTICTKNRIHFFGHIEDGMMFYEEIGEIAHECWQVIPQHFPFVILDEFVIMPNHIHGIIIINKPPEKQEEWQTNKFGPQSKNLASIIRGFKVGVKKYATINGIDFAWQTRYHDHIIRNEPSFYRIKNYIKNNSKNWTDDRFYE